MKIFTNKNVVQKIIIAIVMVILVSFCIPTPVQADLGGKLMSPLVNLLTSLLDGVQHLLEYCMLGETATFMKDIKSNDYEKEEKGPKITVTKFIDATFFGLNAVNIPVITYTPEAIFANRVPALDINFIKPSVTTGDEDWDKEHNVAIKLQSTIAGWYSAIRILAIVGLLSVLVYLGIRMLLTSIATEKAKYKQMFFDWIVAVCLIFALHYIMSFALTMSETVTAMIAPDIDGTITVEANNVDAIAWTTKTVTFSSNLMSYVRFMIQAGDLMTKLGFFFLYLMLVIYSVRFTWIYLKRVVNMAFLTLIAPVVALTYPIDKVSDGKAQAFNMWMKEFAFNALLQPLHLLLYTVLLGTAAELAVSNPIYAVVALGFIITGEKLMKKMFGFDKANGGTVGSLAGAAGVTAVAGKALNSFAKQQGSGGGGKIRTKDSMEREGKDRNAKIGLGDYKVSDSGNTTPPRELGQGTPPPQSGEGNGPQGGIPKPDEPGSDAPTEYSEELQNLENDLAGYDDTDPYFMDLEHQEKQRRYQELREEQARQEQLRQTNPQGVPSPEEANGADPNGVAPDDPQDVPPPETADTADLRNRFAYNGPKEDTIGSVIGQDWANLKGGVKSKFKNVGSGIGDTYHSLRDPEGRRMLKNKVSSGLNRAAIGAYQGLKVGGYKAARGTLKAATGIGVGTLAGVIAATSGNGEAAVTAAMGGMAVGGQLFESTIGANQMPDRSVRDAVSAGVHGNEIDARNARADKKYLGSKKFDDFYEKYYKEGYNPEKKQGYSKDDMKEIVKQYRQVGITSEKDIRTAIKLEERLQKQHSERTREETRKHAQIIVSSYKDMDSSQKRAFTGDEKAKKAEMDELVALTGSKVAAKEIFDGYVDYREILRG